MLIITSAASLGYVLQQAQPDGLLASLNRYSEHLGPDPLAWLFVVQPGDPARLLAQCRGHPFDNWEFIDSRDGWFEAVFVHGDDGFGHVVLIPDRPAIDPSLRAICQQNATIAS